MQWLTMKVTMVHGRVIAIHVCPCMCRGGSHRSISLSTDTPMRTPPETIAPRGLNIRQAAAYWGVSPGTFRKLVRLGLAPAAAEPAWSRSKRLRLACAGRGDVGAGGDVVTRMTEGSEILCDA